MREPAYAKPELYPAQQRETAVHGPICLKAQRRERGNLDLEAAGGQGVYVGWRMRKTSGVMQPVTCPLLRLIAERKDAAGRKPRRGGGKERFEVADVNHEVEGGDEVVAFVALREIGDALGLDQPIVTIALARLASMPGDMSRPVSVPRREER